MPRKMLTRRLVRNLALVVLELVLLSCGSDMVARWILGILLMVSECSLNGCKLAHGRGCDGSSTGMVVFGAVVGGQ
jgi:hypothetical protein